MTVVYVGAGSNSEPVVRLRAAVAALERAFGSLCCSSVYRSVAVGAPAPDYLNLAAAFDCERGADAVKSVLVEIEATVGRMRDQPRSVLCAIDLDLLIHGCRVDAERRLPHPDVLRRAFALGPLAELAPDFVHPVTGERLGSARARLATLSPAIENIGNVETLE